MDRFAKVPKSPNCVSSRADVADKGHYIEPLKGTSFEAAKAALLAMPRTTLVTEDTGYVHVTQRTAILRFVDDVELQADGDVVHVRSASRLGYGDMGVNRRRVESLRAALR